ncbi:hypothetical protein GL213_07590 [Halogeometricum borinquense]|uniref:DUF7999 domain-containing protein n=1 Tax=Halogeometricum borinquense TaxID=60847 RepID=A0A6C0UHH3_9EURY|nr:hypothetical protein [Halogeometricum borinquense]QIB74657.1 hypothetical protein G3I44_10390 [Halogeometricum borinquense]QIQ76390.1 hypothetical protein GL213_07590 [Halogeometricum borinquense]
MWYHTTNPSHTETIIARIEWPMNDHGAMTVRVEASCEVRHLVEFADETVEKTLTELPAGATVPLQMESVGARGNAWRVTELVGVTTEAMAKAAAHEDERRQRRGSETEHRESTEHVEV